MAENTKIEWAHHTFNPWEGCTKVGPGCDHCYAEARNHRFGGDNWGPGKARRRTSPSNWALPLKWDRQAAKQGLRYRVFCASLADVFDNEVPRQWRMDLFSLIAQTPNLDWLILTKRIGNVKRMSSWDSVMFDMIAERCWLGITVVNQEEANRDIPKLLEIPAKLHWLSMEPLLGPVDLTDIHWPDEHGVQIFSALECDVPPEDDPFDGDCVDWVVVGGESGAKARPMHPDWARSLRDQCAEASTPFLFKQWGEWQVASHENGHYSSDMVSNGAYWVDLNGNTHKPSSLDLLDPIAMVKVGKARAGRMLDGQQHDGFPAAPAEGH